MPASAILQDFIETCKLFPLIHDGLICVEITGCMRILPQVGKLSHDQLVRHLMIYSYGPTTHSPGL